MTTEIAPDIDRQRGIGIDQVSPANEKLTPLNEDAEAKVQSTSTSMMTKTA